MNLHTTTCLACLCARASALAQSTPHDPLELVRQKPDGWFSLHLPRVISKIERFADVDGGFYESDVLGINYDYWTLQTDRDVEQVTKETTTMKTHAKATFALKAWDEKPFNEMNGVPKLTRASVTKSYQGDIAGEGKLEYLMMYRDDGSASFVGLERVVGSVGSRSGSFVLQHSGTFKGGVATVTLLVIPDSGTEDLRGLQGSGEFAVGHEQPYSMTLDYDFE